MNYEADRERSNQQVEMQVLEEIFTPTDPGMHHRDYSESELRKIFEFDEETTACLSPRQRNTFIDEEAEDSSRDFDSDHDDATINCRRLSDLSRD